MAESGWAWLGFGSRDVLQAFMQCHAVFFVPKDSSTDSVEVNVVNVVNAWDVQILQSSLRFLR